MANWDFFISYKWNTYAGAAGMLKSIVLERGFTAWLDIDHLFQASQSPSTEINKSLLLHLQKAMSSCRYVLFFETSAQMAMQVGGPSIKCTTWQERELDLAKLEKLVVLYHGAIPKTLAFGKNPRHHDYSNLTDGFAIVERAIADTSRYW